MKIKLLDNYKEFEKEMSLQEIADSISISLGKAVIAAYVNDELKDLGFVVNKDSDVRFITSKDKEAFEILNHSTAHLMAEALKELYSDVKFGVGPAIEEGFYYDFEINGKKVLEEDLPVIEKKMLEISNRNEEIIRNEVSKEEALELFKNDEFKQELINEIPDGETISIYSQGSYKDLCRGPHMKKVSLIKHFKLLSVAGAYFKGDSKNKMLDRIYGVSFFSADELKEHLNNLEERKKRDHRKLGKELGLFMLSEYGPGFPFWLPKGMLLKNALTNFWIDIHTKAGYYFCETPTMLNRELWETSGHWFNYKDNMYTSTIDEKDFAIKPMNCPGGILIYKNEIHSYKDFPLRLAELGHVHRHEASGALNGLFRVRAFTQDDAHVFMTEEQISSEIANIILLYKKVYETFNLSFHIELSTRPENKYIGKIETWDIAEKALSEACSKAGFEYKLNPGDGAFYGPKLDFKLRDSMNRIWQCGTIQLDMNLPERFDLNYIDENGEKKRPVMVHRALFGSLERFIGILIEHYAGAFPVWLSPIQVRIVPVNKEYHLEYSKEIAKQFLEIGIRAELDESDEKLGYKIRQAQMSKVPYTIVIGDKERDNRSVNVRAYSKEEQEELTLDAFINKVLEETKNLK